jgi:hypothetical protein
MSGCKFKKQCLHFREDSFTCKNGGSAHCGQYRIFSCAGQKKHQNKTHYEEYESATEFRRLNEGDKNLLKNILLGELGFKKTEIKKLSLSEAKSVLMLAAIKELSKLRKEAEH